MECFKSTVLAVALLCWTATPVFSALEDYTLYPGIGYYKISAVGTGNLNWADALLECRTDGGHLIIINSIEEANVARELILSKSNGDSSWIYWVGITDLYKTEHYFDIKGNSIEETGYAVWAKGQPNGVGEEHCLVVNGMGQYHDYPCNYNRILGQICEIEIS